MSSREHAALLRPVENVLMMSLPSYAQELKDRREFTDSAPRVVLRANEPRARGRFATPGGQFARCPVSPQHRRSTESYWIVVSYCAM